MGSFGNGDYCGFGARRGREAGGSVLLSGMARAHPGKTLPLLGCANCEGGVFFGGGGVWQD